MRTNAAHSPSASSRAGEPRSSVSVVFDGGALHGVALLHNDTLVFEVCTLRAKTHRHATPTAADEKTRQEGALRRDARVPRIELATPRRICRGKLPSDTRARRHAERNDAPEATDDQ